MLWSFVVLPELSYDFINRTGNTPIKTGGLDRRNTSPDQPDIRSKRCVSMSSRARIRVYTTGKEITDNRDKSSKTVQLSKTNLTNCQL